MACLHLKTPLGVTFRRRKAKNSISILFLWKFWLTTESISTSRARDSSTVAGSTGDRFRGHISTFTAQPSTDGLLSPVSLHSIRYCAISSVETGGQGWKVMCCAKCSAIANTHVLKSLLKIPSDLTGIYDTNFGKPISTKD